MNILLKKKIHRQWHLINAKNKILGRLSSIIAHYLMGKHKIFYLPYIDIGDYIIIINANKIKITGNKKKNKFYFNHSGYSGGLKKISFEKLIKKNPCKIIQHSVKGMLPKNKIGVLMLNRLKIYSGLTHKHIAQKKNILNI
ncbi:50S ribosomal protein L13 [Enterobacteriaceae endosymbiont of Donacia bicoloricornis]|uniref:50S ribosomal protein L13 n=1 Tax=Enterobacteriaceae endosymbiont of Donacia bicoloricornis TaxID=2675772 RepID=UPI001448EB67|nr:50S ribosomal protein L13 [Enterobacteriaceae endosymbiont of Donacia bicoloricornis]QJC37933.1 50S ribosomal protein L13 [Enterobacteriaceae endosymbiont of Donacia bicoloricornis]